MEGKMKAVLKAEAAPGATVALVDIPPVGSRDVLVQVKAASICGTDMHIYEWDGWAQSRVSVPRIFGHEFAGEVVEVGCEVSSLVPGGFVAAETHITCGQCYQCRTGQGRGCRNVQILCVDRDGAFAEYIAIPEKVAWKTGKEIDHSVASIQEPFGNAVHATFAGEITNKTVAVFGCGPIGLLAYAAYRVPVPFLPSNPMPNAWKSPRRWVQTMFSIPVKLILSKRSSISQTDWALMSCWKCRGTRRPFARASKSCAMVDVSLFWVSPRAWSSLILPTISSSKVPACTVSQDVSSSIHGIAPAASWQQANLISSR